MILDLHVDWHCPSCGLTDQTPPLPLSASRMHPCPRMGGMTTPLLRAGIKAKHEAVMREDYTNGDDIQTDDEGRAVMAIKTTRDDGEDVTVFAPTATGGR